MSKSLDAWRADQLGRDGASDWPAARIRESVGACEAWAAAYPAIRYHGCSPCLSADCPRCGAPDGLWVTIHPTEQGWTAPCCDRAGASPESLAVFVGGDRHRGRR